MLPERFWLFLLNIQDFEEKCSGNTDNIEIAKVAKINKQREKISVNHLHHHRQFLNIENPNESWFKGLINVGNILDKYVDSDGKAEYFLKILITLMEKKRLKNLRKTFFQF